MDVLVIIIIRIVQLVLPEAVACIVHDHKHPDANFPVGQLVEQYDNMLVGIIFEKNKFSITFVIEFVIVINYRVDDDVLFYSEFWRKLLGNASFASTLILKFVWQINRIASVECMCVWRLSINSYGIREYHTSSSHIPTCKNVYVFARYSVGPREFCMTHRTPHRIICRNNYAETNTNEHSLTSWSTNNPNVFQSSHGVENVAHISTHVGRQQRQQQIRTTSQ